MKISKEQAQKNREMIIDVASRLFRERGFDGVGVADLMREAGFTHGGFYGHFASKEDLMREACQRAFAESRQRLESQTADEQPVSLKNIATAYARKAHRDAPGKGCPLAALAVSVASQGDDVRTAFTEGLKASIDMLATSVTDCTKAEAKRKSIAAWSMLVGSMILARAVNDSRLSDQILDVGANVTGSE